MLNVFTICSNIYLRSRGSRSRNHAARVPATSHQPPHLPGLVVTETRNSMSALPFLPRCPACEGTAVPLPGCLCSCATSIVAWGDGKEKTVMKCERAIWRRCHPNWGRFFIGTPIQGRPWVPSLSLAQGCTPGVKSGEWKHDRLSWSLPLKFQQFEELCNSTKNCLLDAQARLRDPHIEAPEGGPVGVNQGGGES